ncbi:MAG: cytochrome c peroxidase [Ferruginibacter sp.]
MTRFIFIITLIAGIVACFGFYNTPALSNAQEVKQLYLKHTAEFITETKALQKAIEAGNEKNIQAQFYKTRAAYKQMETLVEYYFHFYAAKLNGPPIPYFEEEEADMPKQEPVGMQVMEEMIFAGFKDADKEVLKQEASELVRYAIELPTIGESFAFDDANIFDAFVEELFRITALGITGFDSQTAVNGLPECRWALNGLQQYLSIYKDEFNKIKPGQFENLNQLLAKAQTTLNLNKDFNAFNRMDFIINCLDPLTKLVGGFKLFNELNDNQGGPYYSAIRKNNSMFDARAFNVNRFLDDYSTSPQKIELGRKLFFDTQLSSNGERSCATCHQPGKAFTDGLTTSLALDGHTQLPRNAPTLWNTALQRNLFHDSRSRTLEGQVMEVLNNAKEMHGSAQTVAEGIIIQPEYSMMYQRAYPGAKKLKAADNICNAIACYERTLVALNSKFDKQMNGKPIMTKPEINGFNLFMGKAKCGTCHFMPLFSGAKPPRYFYMESEVIGVPSANVKKNAKLDADSGRYLTTGYPIHMFSFKTASLRNIALTAPYMHNGVFNTLEEVIDFYNDGGGKGLHIEPENQSLPFDKLNLTKKEKTDIILFMKTLTDTTGKY